VQGICDRDRSVRAGRSHFLIASLSFYILLGDCQGVVGHWEQDFDTGTHLSDIDPYVTYDPFRISVFYPIAPFAIQTQTVQDREQRFVVWAGFHPQDELVCHVDAHFLNHDMH